MNNKLLILTYHLINNSEKEKPFGYHPVFSIEKKTFEKQIQLIKSIIEDKSSQQSESLIPQIAITFDDGFESDYQTAFPVLEKNNVKARFFLNLQNIKNENRWNQYREILNSGHLIGSHGMTHLSFLNLASKELEYQFRESKKIIEDKTSVSCTDFSFPLGAYNSSIIEHGRSAGYTNFYSTRCRLNNITGNENILHRFQLKSNYGIGFFEKIVQGNPLTIAWLKSKSDGSIAIKKLFKNKF